jgi:hypothetical protein
MIAITDIVVREIVVREIDDERGGCAIEREDLPTITKNGAREPYTSDYTIEYMHGTTFVNKRGERVVIGASKEVQQILGLPFDAFSNMEGDIDRLERERDAARKAAGDNLARVYEYENMTLKQRLKFLFTGRVL